MLEIVMGPARSGKLDRGLDRYCRELKDGREASAMWLVPNRDLARSLRQRAALRLGALAEPKILTLDDLARWIFESAGAGLVPLSDVSRQLLLLDLLEKTRDPQLAAARNEPGFARGIARAVDDLKEHLKWPAEGPQPFAGEYDRMLKSHGAVDRKSMVAEAARRLGSDGEFFRSTATTLLLFYGFTSFSPLEWELVRVALKRLPAWMAVAADPARPELFAESMETVRRLEAFFPSAKKEILSGKNSKAQTRLLAFSQYDQELEWIARECARLCREEKFSPDEIAVVSGAGGGEVWWARQIFRRHGLPLAAFSPEGWEDQPALRQGKFPPAAELEQIARLPEEEAQSHFSALAQWDAARRELEKNPLFARHGVAALRQMRFAPARPHFPAVHFYGAEAPPLESYRAVIVSHFLEGSFPRAASWNLFGAAPLREAQEHRRREELAFYLLLTRASERLILCASKKDHQNQEALPSLYLNEWDLFFPASPPPAWEKGESKPLAFSSRSGVGPARARETQVRDPRILDDFRGKLSQKGSITQIEEFAKCPWRHFARKMMRIEEPQEGFTPMWLGSAAHAALESAGPLLAGDSESDLFDAIDAGIEKAFAVPPPGATAAEIALEKETLRRQLKAFARGERQRLLKEGWKPLYFEKGFGEEEKTLYRLDAGEGVVVSLKGKVDRIDVSADGKTAEVIDYKLSSTPEKIDMREGRSLQLQCYLDVCEKIFGFSPAAGAYLSLRGDKKNHRKISSEELREFLDAARGHLKRHARGIMTGDIRAQAAPEECRQCGYRSVCRTDEKER